MLGAALNEIFFFAFTFTLEPSSGLRALRGAEQPKQKLPTPGNGAWSA